MKIGMWHQQYTIIINIRIFPELTKQSFQIESLKQFHWKNNNCVRELSNEIWYWKKNEWSIIKNTNKTVRKFDRNLQLKIQHELFKTVLLVQLSEKNGEKI